MIIKTPSREVSLKIVKRLSDQGWNLDSNLRGNDYGELTFLSVDKKRKIVSWFSDTSDDLDRFGEEYKSVNSVAELAELFEKRTISQPIMKNYTVFYTKGNDVIIKTFSAESSKLVSDKLTNRGIDGFTILEGLPLGETKAGETTKYHDWQAGDVGVSPCSKFVVMKIFDYNEDGKVFFLSGLDGNVFSPYSDGLKTKEQLDKAMSENYKFVGKSSNSLETI